MWGGGGGRGGAVPAAAGETAQTCSVSAATAGEPDQTTSLPDSCYYCKLDGPTAAAAAATATNKPAQAASVPAESCCCCCPCLCKTALTSVAPAAPAAAPARAGKTALTTSVSDFLAAWGISPLASLSYKFLKASALYRIDGTINANGDLDWFETAVAHPELVRGEYN